MNLRPASTTRYLVPLCVIGAGLSLANCVQLAEVYASAGPIWAAWAAIVFMALVCGFTLVIAVALRPVETEPPASQPEPPAPVVDDLRPLVRPDDGKSYEATMARRKPAPWCRLSEPKLARVLDLYKILGGSINVETYVNRHKICTRHELALLRTDLINHGLADGWKGSAVPHERGRAELERLLPHLLRE